jgi:hypothetical protein
LGLPSRIFEKKSQEGEKGDDITRFDGTSLAIKFDPDEIETF